MGNRSVWSIYKNGEGLREGAQPPPFREPTLAGKIHGTDEMFVRVKGAEQMRSEVHFPEASAWTQGDATGVESSTDLERTSLPPDVARAVDDKSHPVWQV